ncbi:MAG TPA: hypothetical protein H9996_00890 [Candidatus Faecalibacterium avium]|uniref:CdaR family protein n=1 Tax=Faecalibacterium sp. An121 TaxID=1965550 RepID=UPI000B385273|nr:CdaR family protein [Faecalibacterium sp. An121]OUQ40458.1 hypothetical protein B5E66_02570 [Faecalibacterium sp. An121]HIV42760.1 hypothetical protein [Candidatus Faecalibacterium avium]
MNPIKKKTSRLESLLQNRSILEDRRVRLVLSALLAVALWVVITTVVQPGTAITLSGVPVDYDYDASVYTSRGLSIVQAPSKTVNLTVSGDGYTIGQLRAEDFVVYPDCSSVRSSGTKTLQLRVRCINSAVAGNISVSIANTDSTVDIVFDVVEEKTLPVQVNTRYLTIEDGYILYSTAASNETVTLTGPSSELADVASCTAEVSYNDPLNDSVTVDTHLRFYNESGHELTFDYVTLDHDTVEVTLTVYKTAQLPVNVRFVNTPPNFDDSVLIYSLSQTELRVAGPADVVDNLSELAVGTIDLSTFALDKVYEMPITLPSGLVSLDNVDTVTVSFNCSAMATKTLNIPAENIEVINLPSTYQLTVESDRLMNVTLCGPASVLESLTADQVVAQIDADDFAVSLGQQNIACSIYVPADGRIFVLGSYTVPCRIESN